MLKRIRITGLGPHVDFRAELDPRGPTTVSGPSEVGKSFLVEAVLFALYGRSVGGRFQPEAIHDDDVRAVVELTLDSGRVIRRSATRSRSQGRSIALADQEESYSSEAAFQQALGDLGRDPETVQLVMVPMLWQELAAGNARKLRDLLARILPPADPSAEVERLAKEAGIELRSGEALLDEKAVAALRRDARKARDEASGRLQLARERLAALEGVSGEPIAVETPSEALVRAVEAWRAWDEAAAQRQWDERRAALGDEPEAADGAKASKQAAAAQQALQATWQGAQQLQAQLQQQQMQLQMFSGGDACPMCQRPGWTQGAAFVQQGLAQVEGLQQQLEAAQAQVRQAQAEAQAAAEAAQVAQAAQAKVAAWRQAIAALGPRPAAVEAAEPEMPRPSDDEVAAVAAWRRAEEAAARLGEQRVRDLEEAREAVGREAARQAELATEADRLDPLLDAVRRAPSLVAAAQARALGDLGPVKLEFGDNPAVRVLVDGRPWWLASRGRQVVADATLRAALRRALQMPWLPLFVDNVQDVGGQPLPAIEGPVIWLQTTDGKGLFVRRRSVRADSSLDDE